MIILLKFFFKLKGEEKAAPLNEKLRPESLSG